MSKEIVTPDQPTITKQVRDAVEVQDVKIKTSTGDVMDGKRHVLFKTNLDKILKEHGVPVQVLKVGHAIEDMVVNAVAEIMAEDLTKSVEEAKAAGKPVDVLKEMKTLGKIATGHGNIKLTARAYAENSNPQNPGAGKLQSAMTITARVADAHNLRTFQESPWAARVKTALGMKN